MNDDDAVTITSLPVTGDVTSTTEATITLTRQQAWLMFTHELVQLRDSGEHADPALALYKRWYPTLELEQARGLLEEVNDPRYPAERVLMQFNAALEDLVPGTTFVTGRVVYPPGTKVTPAIQQRVLSLLEILREELAKYDRG